MLWPAVIEEAHKLGYAVGLHGSLQRDLDVIAVPWTEEAASAEELVEAISERLGCFVGTSVDGRQGPTEKPHGRLAWSLMLSGHAYIDLSVMPRRM